MSGVRIFGVWLGQDGSGNMGGPFPGAALLSPSRSDALYAPLSNRSLAAMSG